MEREPSCCPAVDKTGTCRIPGPRASILTGGRHAAGGCPPAPPGSPRLSAVPGWAPAVPSRLLARTPHLTALLEMADFLVLYVVGFFFLLEVSWEGGSCSCGFRARPHPYMVRLLLGKETKPTAGF